MVSTTSARPSAGRPGVPAKMTSSILPPRSAFAPCSPSTQAMASTTLLLTEPFGPTTAVMPGSNFSVVEVAKDLKPFSVRLLRCTRVPGTGGRGEGRDERTGERWGQTGGPPLGAPLGSVRSLRVGGFALLQSEKVRRHGG